MKTNVQLPGENVLASDVIPEKVSSDDKSTEDKTYSKLFVHGQRPDDPFREPSTQPPYWKILLWGDTATLKSRTALHFPNPCVLDLERGTVAYRNEFNFHVREVATVDEVVALIRWLRDHKHQYKTFVFDTISQFYFSLRRKWSDIFLKRLGGRKGHRHEFFDFGPKEWDTVKSEFSGITQALVGLPMNIVVIAHNKPVYSSGTGSVDMMTQIGESFDADKKLSRPFDCIMHMQRDGQKFFSTVIKDRTAKLPATISDEHGGADYYAQIEQALGKDALHRSADPVARPTAKTMEKLEGLLIELRLPEDKIAARLEAYGVNSFADLSRDQAKEILAKLIKAKEAAKS